MFTAKLLQMSPDDLKEAVAGGSWKLKLNADAEGEQNNLLCTLSLPGLSAKLEVNYVTGDALEAFRQAALPVYQHYMDRGEITSEEIEAVRAAVQGE